MTEEEIKEYWRTAYCNEKYKKENLEKRIAELEYQLTHRNCLDCSNHSSKLRMRNLELEKENAELKADNDARKFAMAMSEKVEKQLREEVAELKLKLEALEGQTPWKDIKDKSKLIERLSKATELIELLLSDNRIMKAQFESEEQANIWFEHIHQAEQFLNIEVEK